MFLRNTAYIRTSKLHIVSNPQFLPCLLAYLSSQQLEQHSRIKAYAAACLWVVLFNHQGVKAVLNRPEIHSEMQLLRQEYQRQADIATYLPDNPPAEYNSNHLLPHKQELPLDNEAAKVKTFILSALTGILGLLQQTQ